MKWGIISLCDSWRNREKQSNDVHAVVFAIPHKGQRETNHIETVHNDYLHNENSLGGTISRSTVHIQFTSLRIQIVKYNMSKRKSYISIHRYRSSIQQINVLIEKNNILNLFKLIKGKIQLYLQYVAHVSTILTHQQID